jgi:hypothetical protein
VSGLSNTMLRRRRFTPIRNTIWAAAILVLVHGGAYGQVAAPVQFEVATVKVNAPARGGGIRVMMRGGPMTPAASTMKALP